MNCVNIAHHQRAARAKRMKSAIIEALEVRRLLSTGTLLPSWSAQEPGPLNSQVIAEGGHADVSTYDPFNGDLLVAYQAAGTSGITYDNPIVVAAYKSNGNGGLELDDEANDPSNFFGGFNNDGVTTIGGGTPGAPQGESGYSIVNVWALIDPTDFTSYSTPFDERISGIAVDSTGRIDVLFTEVEAGNGNLCLLQLEPNGTETDSLGDANTFGNTWGSGIGNANEGGNGAEELFSVDSDGENPIGYGIVIDPVTGDILIGGAASSGPYGGSENVFAIFSQGVNAGGFDPSFGNTAGEPGQFQLTANPDGTPVVGFGAITTDPDGDIFAAATWDGSISGTTAGVGVVKITPDGASVDTTFNSTGPYPGWVEITSVPALPENSWLLAPFGIGLTSAGNIIVGSEGGGSTGGNFQYVGYALSTLDSSGAFSSAGIGQQFVSSNSIAEIGQMQMQVNPDGDVIVNAASTFYPGGTWFSGSNNQQLFDPYQNVAFVGYANFFGSGVALSGSATPLGNDPNAGIPEVTLALYGTSPSAPLFNSAQSVFDEGGTDYGISLNISPVHGAATGFGGDGITTEGRVSSEANADLIELTFAGSISDTEISTLTVTLVDPLGNTDGTWIPGDSSVSGDVLTLAVYGMTNADSLMLTVNGVVNDATGVAGTYEVYMGVLGGDSNGDGTVNSEDFTLFSENFGEVVNDSSFRADFNADGVINSEDFTIFSNDLNKALSEVP